MKVLLQRTRYLIAGLFLLIISCAKIQLQNQAILHHFFPNWTMYGGNPARTNSYPGHINLPLKLLWQQSTSAAVGKTILISDGIIFFSTMEGNIYAYSIGNGEKIGRVKTEFHATQIVKDSILIIARRYGDDTLFKYQLKTGKFDWGLNAGDIASEPLIFDNQIVVTALYNHIDLYDLSTSERIWQTNVDDHIHSSPATDGNIIVFGCDDNFIYAVNYNDGEIIWKFKTNASVQATPVIFDQTVFIGSSDKNFYALDLASGEEKWHFRVNGKILQAAAVNDSLVIFGATDEHIYCLDRKSGDRKWTFKAGSIISTCPLICDDKVFFGSLDHHYYGLDVASGRDIWKYKTKGRVRTAPVIWGNYFIGASEDHHLYVFSSAEEIEFDSK